MSQQQFDLIVRAGGQAVAVRDGIIVAIGDSIASVALARRDYPDGTLLPGLVDFHAHPAIEGSQYGIDPDQQLLPCGVTTVLSQGEAGADNFDRYVETTIAVSRTRVRLALNLSRRGESMAGGCFERLEDAEVEACLATLRRGGDSIWGVAVNLGESSCSATDPREIMRRACRVRDESGKPLLVGLRRFDQWSMVEQLALLKCGDVVTYCFRPAPNCLLDERGRIHPAVHQARARGVRFDAAHGMNSFSFAVAAAALAEGFLPDTISSDQYVKHIGSSPPHCLALMLAKLIAAGMPEREAFAAVTIRPAAFLGLSEEIGSLEIGKCADLIVLRSKAGTLTDCFGVTRRGTVYEAACVVRGGELV